MRKAETAMFPASLVPSLIRHGIEKNRKGVRAATKALTFALSAMLVLPGFAFGTSARAAAASETAPTSASAPKADPAAAKGGAPRAAAAAQDKEEESPVHYPTRQPVQVFAPINVRQLAEQEALAPSQAEPTEIRAINPPASPPEDTEKGLPGGSPAGEKSGAAVGRPLSPAPSATGVSPAPFQTFKGEFETAGSIPPDTMGAVGTTHIMTPTNERVRIQTRDGADVIPRFTLNSFWSGVVLEGGATPATFDPKIYFDRFNNRFIFVVTTNSVSVATRASSATLVAVSATADPTGTWFRYAIDVDPAATATSGIWADYPSVGFNKNWITININRFQYGDIGGGVIGTTAYFGPALYVIDKAAAYAGPAALTVSTFQNATIPATCPFTEFGCGFTMAPTVTEDNTTNTTYLVENWNATSGILRVSKITGTPAAPVLTVALQAPSSPFSWRTNAARIDGTSGGYMPQKQQQAHLASGTRIMANDARILNAVLRNGSLWAVQHIMVAAAPTPAGTGYGAANPDIRTAIQWWEIDPSIEGVTFQPPIQRARIEDPLADNCHNGTGGTRTTGPCITTGTQVGQFFSFPTIAVNQNDDVLIGFSVMSPLTYPNAGYSFRSGSDPLNTMRDYVVYRPGQANYNIGAGAGVNRQNRWGDYSAAQTDPLNDTDFWTIQEYAGSFRDFGLGARTGNWETWYALVKPTGPAPVNVSTSGLIISEFRARGPQGIRDEFIELYNPSNNPIRVTTGDNSDGWAVGFDNGTAASPLGVVPYGTVIPARGHFLITNNQDASAAGAPNLVYSLGGYPNDGVRPSDSDTGYALDLGDNLGVAIFNTSTRLSFTLANRIDAAGFASAPALYREGAGIPDITAATPTGNISFLRNLTSGTSRDTNDNAADFFFLNTNHTETLGSTPRLGAPGPENLDSPVIRTSSGVTPTLVFPCIGSNTGQNRVRDPAPVTNGTLGTLSVRRRFTNNLSVPVRRLRIRIVDITTAPAPAGVADLRVITSGPVTVPAGSNPCGTGAVTIQGTTLEEPPAQPLGGGWNSTLSAGVVTLSSPLAPGASVDLQLLTGVQQGGSFRFFIMVEALP